MTAEIVVMNKTAVAMAADSVVSVGDAKEYRSADKLFALRPDLPVGVMIYNAADFAFTPWEVVLKGYRQSLPPDGLPTLDDYLTHFLHFLATDQQHFPPDVRTIVPRSNIDSIFAQMRTELDAKVDEKLATDGQVDPAWTEQQFDELLDETISGIQRTKALEASEPDFLAEVAELAHDLAPALREDRFQNLLDDDRRNKLDFIAELVLSRECGREQHTGVVLAGYGTEQVFPAAREVVFHMITPRNVAFIRDADRDADVTSTTGVAAILPCAQRYTVDTFVSGMDPRLMNQLFNGLRRACAAFSDDVVKDVEANFGPDQQVLADFQQRMSAAADQVSQGLADGLKQRSESFWQGPMINAVAVLPKDELANMAEALVSITSLRQRVSLTRETVGGPIDVCVISKPEGLVWIKRKHYFPSELNPQYFSRFQK